MKKQLIISLLLACLASNTLANTSKTTSTQTTSNPNSISLSFVITAQDAHLMNSHTSGQYLLILNGVNPYVTYYTARPNRDSGLAATSNFVTSWKVGSNNFAQDNPNAVLTSATIDSAINKSGQTKIFQVSSPKYNFNTGEMSFVVTPIGKNNQILIKNENFQGVNLIIN